jgi:phospholipid/cholesterol/gamma-HCH transport system substrate-binding protein
MEDSNREFQVGLMVIAAMIAIVIMVFRFGDIGQTLKPGMQVDLILPSAAGVIPQTPVHMRGIPIGRVRDVQLLPSGQGVRIGIRIDPGFSFPSDSTALVSRSLLGDAVVEIQPGDGEQPIQPADQIAGQPAGDPMAVVANMEQRVSATLASFEQTGAEWSRLAANLNRMLESRGPDGVNTLEQTSLALKQFTQTMVAAEETLASASSLFNDPEYQKQLRNTMTALPELLNETRTTLSSVHQVVNRMDTTVATIHNATAPLAQHSDQLVTNLAKSLQNVQSMTRDLASVSRVMNQEDGSLRRLMTDPSMYRNLDHTAASLSALLQNLKPVIADLQVFSDKIARHPELLGVRGVVRGSDGVKNDGIRAAGYERPRN